VSAIQEIIQESGGAIAIDDVLPLFPNFEEIGLFRELICTSLEQYSKQIDDLKSEMKIAADSNTQMRAAITKLGKRSGAVDVSKTRCMSCSRLLKDAPSTSRGPSGGALPAMYLFPTGNSYHGSCLCHEVSKLSPKVQQDRIRTLSKALSEINVNEESRMQEIKSLKDDLEREIAGEDPFCGENVSMLITKPFICSEEEISSWSL